MVCRSNKVFSTVDLQRFDMMQLDKAAAITAIGGRSENVPATQQERSAFPGQQGPFSSSEEGVTLASSPNSHPVRKVLESRAGRERAGRWRRSREGAGQRAGLQFRGGRG